MVVNPVSKVFYFSVHTRNGTPVLLKLVGKELKNVSLKNAISKEANDRRGRSQRRWAISDMKYYNGKVFVSGLYNKE